MQTYHSLAYRKAHLSYQAATCCGAKSRFLEAANPAKSTRYAHERQYPCADETVAYRPGWYPLSGVLSGKAAL